MNEDKFKSMFCTSIAKQGGYTIRIAAPLISGLPDIYCSVPGYAPLLLEAKFIKGLKGNFTRKIKLTKLQSHILNNCWKRNINTAFCLIGIEYNGDVFCGLMPPTIDTLHHYNLCNFYPITDMNIKFMLEKWNVPKIF